MKTRLLVGLGLIVAAVAIYLLFGRRDAGPPVTATPASDTAKVDAASPAPAASAAPERGGAESAAEARFDVADDPPGELRLEGQVIDGDERPVGGAVVRLSSNPPRTAKTELDGSFAFDKLVARQYTVSARKDDAHGGPLAVRLTAKKEPVILVLKATGGLEVTVVTMDGKKPVASAEVEVEDAPDVAGTTGADGKVLLRGLAPGWQQVVARAPGYAPAMTIAETSGRAGDLSKATIELKTGAAISGRVVDRAGKPVAGARVRPVATSSFFDVPDSKKDTVVTKADGAWSFPALPGGTFRFAATHDAHGPGLSGPVTLDGKIARKEVEIKLEEGARIAGKVVRRDGTPVPSAAVRVIGRDAWDAGSIRQVYSDDRGAFEVTGLARRKVDVLGIEEQASSEMIEVDLETKPEQLDVTITLDVEGTIAGTVVDAKGEPMPEAQVAAIPEIDARRSDPTAWRARGIARDTTDSAGRFELRGLPDGSYGLRAGRSGELMAMMQRRTVTAKTGDLEVKLVLEDDGKVKGRVLYDDGSAPELFHVSTFYGRGTPFTGTDGSFEVDAAPGSVTLTVTGPTFVQKTVAEVKVAGGETADVGTITVERGRSVSGRVLDASGAPVAGAKVVGGGQLMGSGSQIASGGLFGGGPGVKSTTSGEDGGYVLAGVGARSLVVVAETNDARSNMARLPAGTESLQLDLVLLTSGSLEGKVTSDGKPVGQGAVIAQPQQASRGNFIVQVSEDGRYRFDKLSPDTYRVSATQGAMMRGGLHTKVVTIEPEKTVVLDLDLPAGGVVVTVSLAPPPGVSVTTAQVFLVSGNIAAANAEQFTDRIGEMGAGSLQQGFVLKGEPVKLENVKPGTYSACAIPIPGDINNPADMIKIQNAMDKLVVACQPATIAADPPEQSLAVKVPAPPPI